MEDLEKDNLRLRRAIPDMLIQQETARGNLSVANFKLSLVIENRVGAEGMRQAAATFRRGGSLFRP